MKFNREGDKKESWNETENVSSALRSHLIPDISNIVHDYSRNLIDVDFINDVLEYLQDRKILLQNVSKYGPETFLSENILNKEVSPNLVRSISIEASGRSFWRRSQSYLEDEDDSFNVRKVLNIIVGILRVEELLTVNDGGKFYYRIDPSSVVFHPSSSEESPFISLTMIVREDYSSGLKDIISLEPSGALI